MGSMEFRVDRVPDPDAVVGGNTSVKIEKELLMAFDGVYAKMPEWFKFDLSFKVTGFTVSTTDKGGYVIDLESKSNKFTPEQQNLFSKLNRGQKITIEDITAVGPDGSTRPLRPIVLRIK